MQKGLVIAMALFVSGALSAAPKMKPCNALKVDRCKERADCVWVDAHKTKDGKDVKAHCKCKGKCAKQQESAFGGNYGVGGFAASRFLFFRQCIRPFHDGNVTLLRPPPQGLHHY